MLGEIAEVGNVVLAWGLACEYEGRGLRSTHCYSNFVEGLVMELPAKKGQFAYRRLEMPRFQLLDRALGHFLTVQEQAECLKGRPGQAFKASRGHE